ncbi:MAG: Crp/Fnr family transcriptional regulator [Alistipes sp.]|nr:Crp/Fnr family transcriptional regulator [Alistipes sp.]
MVDFSDSIFVKKMREVFPVGEEAVAELAAHLEECTFARRDMILRADVYCRYAWFVERGLVRHYWLEEERETVTSFSVEGHIVFSMDELYYGKPSQEYAQAVEAVEAWRISVGDLEQLFRSNLELCNWGRLIHQNEYRRLHRSHKERLTLSAEARYQMFVKQFPDICSRAPLGDIASYLGMDPSTLSRVRG